MKNYVIRIKNLSKVYRLGVISSGTLAEDISNLWSRYFLKKNSVFLYIMMIRKKIDQNKKMGLKKY